ncbi:MAG: SdiA-regulated domain-containing protein [Lewinellaceae bacterium]|nr:SdiA-regulated domain-containing protein [Phaeodactylibacter sp.]MCB9039968.1 SdiA-regulated domain-containing protein [Lewinellaceae bacterium]
MVPTLFLIYMTLIFCNSPAEESAGSITLAEGYHFAYDLKDPDQTFKMPKKLEEISGLGISENGQALVAIQDEDGKLFFLNRYTGEVFAEIEFWKDGDYEGVEMVGETAYVVKSTGTIYEVSHPGTPEQKVENYNFFLDADNDVEGLAYDRAHNRLLLACKAKAGKEKDYKHKKGIYGFDLNTRTLGEKPVYFVSLDSVNSYLDKDPAIRKLEKVVEFFDPDEDFEFSPSAIAIHPLTGNLYLTSSVGKMLLVLNPNGQIMHIEKLSKKIHPQPEGLCFDPEGTLYISNEGKGEKGLIYRFNYKPGRAD